MFGTIMIESILEDWKVYNGYNPYDGCINPCEEVPLGCWGAWGGPLAVESALEGWAVFLDDLGD